MTPEQVLTNVVTFLKVLLPLFGAIAGVGAVLLYGGGKFAGNPRTIDWGKSAAIGAIVLFGGNAVISILQNISTRTFGA